MDIVKAAERIARNAHCGQFRKYGDGKTPYVTHPERVAKAATALGYGPTAVAAAWLHDVFEDCAFTWRDEVARECDPSVFVLVCELTNPTKGMKSPRAIRKAIDREHLRHVSATAVSLKLLDRTDNLNEMLGADADFKRLYCGESRDLLNAIRTAHQTTCTAHV